jgi:predicted secreted hydrolase
MAISDVNNRSFHNAEVLARGARIGVAGASVSPTRIWLRNWAIAHDDANSWRITASEAGMALDVRVMASKALVLQGREGYSRKGAASHAASYYYALTRLEGSGQIRLGDARFNGSVRLWLDREWSSSALSANQVGWDWVGLQLDDGRDLMLYRLRNSDGSVDPFSAGALIDADGQRTGLDLDDFEMKPEQLQTLGSGRRYPLQWHLRVPGHGLDLTVAATFPEQEHTGMVAYWEGLVEVRDGSGNLAGHGYLEMTGY